MALSLCSNPPSHHPPTPTHTRPATVVKETCPLCPSSLPSSAPIIERPKDRFEWIRNKRWSHHHHNHNHNRNHNRNHNHNHSSSRRSQWWWCQAPITRVSHKTAITATIAIATTTVVVMVVTMMQVEKTARAALKASQPNQPVLLQQPQRRQPQPPHIRPLPLL